MRGIRVKDITSGLWPVCSECYNWLEERELEEFNVLFTLDLNCEDLTDDYDYMIKCRKCRTTRQREEFPQ